MALQTPSTMQREVESIEPENVPTNQKQRDSGLSKTKEIEQFELHHFSVEVPPDHSYRIGFIGGLWSEDFPHDHVDHEVVNTLLKILKIEDVQLVFISDTISLEDEENPQGETLALIDRHLKQLFTTFRNILGPNFPLFPVFDCPIQDAETVMPLVFKNFQLPESAARGLYDVSIGNANFLVTPTYDFNPKFQLVAQTQNALMQAETKAHYRFVTGYNPVFPVTSQITNQNVRNAFWTLLEKQGVRAYFSFGEHVFNRLQKKKVWEIITGGGGGPFNGSPSHEPFFHCVLLRIPTETNANPIVQVLDRVGNVIDEFELLKDRSLLHQFHISKE